MIEALGFVLIVVGVLVLFVMGSRRPKRDSPLNLKPPPLPRKVETELDALAALERMGQIAKAQAASDEKVRKRLRPFGVFGRLATYASLFLALFIFKPKDISDT